MKNKNNELVAAQIKTTNKINLSPSSVNPGKDSFNVWLSSGIRLKGEKDLGVVIDSNNNFLVFGPQMQYVKNPETGEWVKSGLGFKRSGGVHYIDINSDGINDFYTNIPI